MKYEVRSKTNGRWTEWRDWLSSGGPLSRAADEFFAPSLTGTISFKRPGWSGRLQFRVKK